MKVSKSIWGGLEMMMFVRDKEVSSEWGVGMVAAHYIFFCLMKERQVASTVDLPVRFQNEKSMDDVIIISW